MAYSESKLIRGSKKNTQDPMDTISQWMDDNKSVASLRSMMEDPTLVFALEGGQPVGWKKYDHSQYKIKVDELDQDKAKEIQLFSLARPHMRAFHCSWFALFAAFLIWFSISPLLSQIRDDLNISNEDIWTSSVASLQGTLFLRFCLGPLCHKFGARTLFSVVLCLSAIATACTGLIQTGQHLILLRLGIGMAGSCVVMCHYWSNSMFTRDVIGTVNGLCTGWGNVGGGLTQLIMGSILFPTFKNMLFAGDAEKAWRTVCLVPAAFAFLTGIVIYYISDDCALGNYRELKKHKSMPEVSATEKMCAGAMNINAWFLFIQYACSFGVELTMNNAASLYFRDEFGLSLESAAAIASVCGSMNLFARGLGGYLSDRAMKSWGMRGRLLIHMFFLLAEGALVLVFSKAESLIYSIVVMIAFSFFVQAAEGSTFGIVPYVDPSNTGSVTGLVGAGGSTGAIGFGLTFRQLGYGDAFFVMGCAIMGTSLLSAVISIKKHSAMFWGKEVQSSKKSRRKLKGGRAKKQQSYNIHTVARNAGGSVRTEPGSTLSDASHMLTLQTW
eukprot:CAMPEP_0172450178 /NCGR_PEP_ID=MMETSP1065-20121228/8637_1 /TAXON_ID=265537 /ORGANISM="Amphiprora paludosa, Strain CCMP125" /LENGTH=555 /DNA_ID=CAMNT_0013201955 /DNA_START=279 /DNA_END=1946 /DNA_ORIENTATION=-